MELQKNLGVYAVGYGYSVVIGGIITFISAYLLRRLHGTNTEIRRSFSNAVMGCLERILYTSSILIGLPQFIAVWLAFKAVGRWGIKFDELKKPESHLTNLINNCFSILYAVAGGLFIKFKYLKDGYIVMACLFYTSCAILGIIFYINIKLYRFALTRQTRNRIILLCIDAALTVVFTTWLIYYYIIK